MSPSKKCLGDTLAPIFKAAGYRKKALTWHHASSDVVRVFNAQRSQWSDAYYFNLGLSLRAIEPAERPPEYCCQVRLRLDELVPDRLRLHRLLDFEDHTVDGVRGEELASLVSGHALPWLTEYGDEAALRRLVSQSRTMPPMIDITLRNHFASTAIRRV